MFHNKKRRSVSPIWIFALVYAAYSLFVPLLKLSALLIGIGLASGAASAAAIAVKKKIEDYAETEAPAPVTEHIPAAPKAEEKRYSPEVERIIADGDLALGEMKRLLGSIQNEGVRTRLREITNVSEKIIQDAKDDESDVPQIRKFLDFYMPTTLKLLNAYDRMDAAGVEGATTDRSKKSIEEMLDTTIDAYKKQLDALFDNQAMDIDAEIRSMKSLLNREGFGDKNPLDWNSFKAQYDKEEKEKGTVQNG